MQIVPIIFVVFKSLRHPYQFVDCSNLKMSRIWTVGQNSDPVSQPHWLHSYHDMQCRWKTFWAPAALKKGHLMNYKQNFDSFFVYFWGFLKNPNLHFTAGWMEMQLISFLLKSAQTVPFARRQNGQLLLCFWLHWQYVSSMRAILAYQCAICNTQACHSCVRCLRKVLKRVKPMA